METIVKQFEKLSPKARLHVLTNLIQRNNELILNSTNTSIRPEDTVQNLDAQKNNDNEENLLELPYLQLHHPPRAIVNRNTAKKSNKKLLLSH